MSTNDQAAATIPMPIVERLRLSDQTGAWLADRVQERKLVGWVWDKLAELERAGNDPRLIGALRAILTRHQPTSAGRCPTCRRHRWRSRPFPRTVWHQIRSELLGVFTGGGRHRTQSRIPSD